MNQPPEPPVPPAPAAEPPVPDAAAPVSALPEPTLSRRRRRRISLVWLVPVLALLIGASLLVRSILASGPRIEISFKTAESLEAGKTEVRYKEVSIGRVESVNLQPGGQGVVATVQLDRSAADMARQDTQFWVVRPRIGSGGVSGLGTLFSGAYIGVDVGVDPDSRRRYVGLEAPPFVLRGEPGAIFTLSADDLGSLDVGSPVFYRRTRVGRVVGSTLDPKKDELSVKVFVEAPYHQLVTPQTRFWNASGVDLSLNASGLTLNTQTLASVLAGGVAFEEPAGQPRMAPAADGTRFFLFNDRKTALAPPDGVPVQVRLVFDQSVRGLALQAPVDFLGVEIGQVTHIALQYDPQRKQRFPVEVLAQVYPLRLGGVRAALLRDVPAGPNPMVEQALWQRLVDAGMRAQLRTGNLLTGQQYVALDFEPKAGRLPLETRNGAVTLPTVPGALSELQPQVSEIIAKVNRIPFDDIGKGLKDTLDQANQAIARLTPDARAALSDVQRTLQSAQASLDRLDKQVLDPAAPVQRGLDNTLAEVQRAAQSLRVLADYLQRHPDALLRGKPADAPLPPAPAGVLLPAPAGATPSPPAAAARP